MQWIKFRNSDRALVLVQMDERDLIKFSDKVVAVVRLRCDGKWEWATASGRIGEAHSRARAMLYARLATL